MDCRSDGYIRFVSHRDSGVNVVVVVNPKSGSSAPRSDLENMFTKAKVSVDAWIEMTDNFAAAISPWCEAGATIAVIGGDGTIASVTNAIVGTNAILAPLPGGTLNHFTKDAGIDQDLATAIANLPKTAVRSVDLATINGTAFLNNSSIGMYPVSLQTRARFEDRLGKWPAAVIGSIRALSQFRLYEVTINGTTFKTPFLFVGNNEYRLDGTMARTDLDTGMLCVYAIAAESRKALVALLGAALIGRLHQQDNLITFQSKSVTIHTKRSKMHVSIDGELIECTTPLEYTCIAGGLRIIGSS